MWVRVRVRVRYSPASPDRDEDHAHRTHPEAAAALVVCLVVVLDDHDEEDDDDDEYYYPSIAPVTGPDFERRSVVFAREDRVHDAVGISTSDRDEYSIPSRRYSNAHSRAFRPSGPPLPSWRGACDTYKKKKG